MNRHCPNLRQNFEREEIKKEKERASGFGTLHTKCVDLILRDKQARFFTFILLSSSSREIELSKGLQGYLAHKKMHPRWTLQKGYAWGPTVVLGGWRFVMSEAPLYEPKRPFSHESALPTFEKHL